MLEQKLAEAKEDRRKKFISLLIGFVVIVLFFCAIFIIAYYFQTKSEVAESISLDPAKEIEKNIAPVSSEKYPSTPHAVEGEKLRQKYIDELNYFENTIKPQFNKIDLNKWDKPRADHLAALETEALTKFSIANYAQALNYIEELKQLSEAIIFDSKKQFEEEFSNAQEAFNADNYHDARFFINNALMLNNESEDAIKLSDKIDDLSEILPLLERLRTAKVENNYEKELNFIKQILELDPKRQSSIERKHQLIDIINKKNFKLYITKSSNAIEKGDAKKAKQSLMKAKNIYPNRSEIKDTTIALQKFEKNQRFKQHQQAAQTAIASDDWETAKEQLGLALQERTDDKSIQESLTDATMIIALQNDLNQYIANPYRLSRKLVLSNVKSKILEAELFTDISPSLNNQIETLSRLIEDMSKKINVEIISDNQTNIIVRRVGVVGVTKSKIIQLAPGRYTFEGKRKGFKSKLIDVLIPYDKISYQLDIICDEPI